MNIMIACDLATASIDEHGWTDVTTAMKCLKFFFKVLS